MTSDEAQRNYFLLVRTLGTPDEIEKMTQDLQLLTELKQTFANGSMWEPMSHVILIEKLVSDAEMLARRRQSVAKQQHYRDWQGKVGRSVEEENITVEAQLALQLCLGIPLGQPTTKERARVVGNAGEMNEAFCPLHNPYQHHHIVDPKTPDAVRTWLVVPEGDHSYRVKGWMWAKDAKQEQYLQTHQREGGVSKAYWVKPEELWPVESYWVSDH